VADREFVFGNPELQKLIIEKFVPLAMDDWYLRRQKDENGRFFMAMTAASPRGDAGDNTRQGRYVFTAAGKFLGFNNNRSPERILAMLRQSLAAYDKLPDNERKPEGEIGEVKAEPRFDRTLPKNGAVVKVFTRVLDKKADGGLCACTAPAAAEGDFQHRGFDAAIDHLWLREEDIKKLLPAKDTKPGTPVPFPNVLSARLARFHLCDNSRGEPPHWERSEIKKAEFFLTPESATRAKLTGTVHLETKNGKRGFAGAMDGWLEYKNGKLTEWKAVVTGEHWGEASTTAGARPGKNPIGFAFVLCPKPAPADTVPPQGSRWLQGYYEAERE
jgi:hypothetical protein